MPLHDLNLEFEDEDETPKKSHVLEHPELEFKQPDIQKPKAVSRPTIVPRPAEDDDQVAAAPVKAPAPVPRAVASPQVKATLAPAYESDNAELIALRAEMQKMQIDSQIKLGVAEFKVEILSAMLSDMKILEHQIGQLLTRIHGKNPELKPEVLMIKKLLADFTAKKRR